MTYLKSIVKKLFEDAELDKKFRDQARRIYNDLVSYLEGGGRIDFRNGLGLFVITSDFTDPVDERNPLKIVWTPETPRKGDASYFKKGNSRYLVLRTLDQKNYVDESERREKVLEGLKNNSDVFIHELIHYFDDLRSEKDIGDVVQYKQSIEKDPETYYTDPLEMNAYYQSVMGEFEGFIEDDSHFKFMMENRWERDFKKFQTWIFENVFPDEFLNNIGRKEKRKLVKRLYKYWQTLEDRYENLSEN